MDLMRISEALQLLQVIPTGSAHLAVFHLGVLGLIQFKDAGEFFCSAQRSVVAQQRQLEANQSVQNSPESPFLEQVLLLFCSFHTVQLHSIQDLITSMLQIHHLRWC